MTSTYVHAYMAFHAYSNQMLTKSLTDSIARYAAARQTKSNRRSPIAGLWSQNAYHRFDRLLQNFKIRRHVIHEYLF